MSTKNTFSTSKTAVTLAAGFMLCSTNVDARFEGVAGFRPRNSTNTSSQHCCDGDSITIIQETEYTVVDPLTIWYLLEKDAEGPVEELAIFKENRAYYLALLSNHIEELNDKLENTSGIQTNNFFVSAMFTGFFSLLTATLTCQVISELVEDHLDTEPYPFYRGDAFLAMIGPVGALVCIFCGIRTVRNYKGNIKKQIKRCRTLLARLEAAT